MKRAYKRRLLLKAVGLFWRVVFSFKINQVDVY